MRHLPFGIAGERHGLPLLVLAPQRGDRCMAKSFCIGLLPFFARHPTSCLDSANNGLPALVHGHVLHRDLLLAAGSVALKRLQLSRKGAGELVEGPLGAVLLGNVLDVTEAAREGHDGHVDGRYLTREHGLVGSPDASAPTSHSALSR